MECRYIKGQTSDLSNLVSTGFMVKSPFVYPMVQSMGYFSVMLAIAEGKLPCVDFQKVSLQLSNLQVSTPVLEGCCLLVFRFSAPLVQSSN